MLWAAASTIMPPESKQPGGGWGLIIFTCLGILVVGFAPFVIAFIGLGTAMSSFGPPRGPSQTPPGLELAGFIILGALPLLIFLIRRRFSNRNK